jgi:hypothetical protein
MDAPPALDLARPRGLGGLLDATMALYVRHFAIFALSALGVVAVVDLLLLGVGEGLLTSGYSGGGSWWWAGESIAYTLVATPLVTAVHVRIVQDIADGRTPGLRRALRQGAAAFPIVALVVLVYCLGILLGMLLLIVPGIYLAIRWLFAPQVAVVEASDDVGEALSGSSDLVRGSWWRVFGISLVLYTLAFAAAAILGIPLELAADALDSGALELLATIVLGTVSLSFVALTGTLLYFDLRARLHLREAPPA